MTALPSRPELTFAGNRNQPRHDWLRLTPAYSRKIVEGLLDDADRSARVLDPFSGSGTTVLSAAQRGMSGDGVELNPFLVWLGGVKLHRFASKTIGKTRDAATDVLKHRRAMDPPPIHNIERWWSADVLRWLCRVSDGIDQTRGPVRNLLRVAFCRTMIGLSGAAFNHVSMSFKTPENPDSRACAKRFRADVEHVLEGAAHAPSGDGRVLRGDARELGPLEGKYDLVITSPPYPNRMSYIRELRPYMYWTGHLEEARDAGELDWKAIGGTWGIATSRLKEWKRTSGECPSALKKVLPKVRKAHEKNGPLLASYLDRYFEDTEKHLKKLRKHVRKGGTIHYVVGNSTFYGELIPVEDLYAELMERAGFKHAKVETLRKRNSKKELYEFEVSATL